MTDETETSSTEIPAEPIPHVNSPEQSMRELSGRWMVVGMFCFASIIVGTLYLYWNLHTAPFLPLQEALVEKFPGSRPLVQGGQRKKHRGTPMVLRITMEVDQKTYQSRKLFEHRLSEVLAITKANADLSSYQELELHLFWPEAEREIQQRKTVYNLRNYPAIKQIEMSPEFDAPVDPKVTP